MLKSFFRTKNVLLKVCKKKLEFNHISFFSSTQFGYFKAKKKDQSVFFVLQIALSKLNQKNLRFR